MLKFKRNKNGLYTINFFMDVSLLTIKELSTKIKLHRYDLDGSYTRNGDDQWIFERRLDDKSGILYPSPVTKFLDDELKRHLRCEKIKKLNKKQKIIK